MRKYKDLAQKLNLRIILKTATKSYKIYCKNKEIEYYDKLGESLNLIHSSTEWW